MLLAFGLAIVALLQTPLGLFAGAVIRAAAAVRSALRCSLAGQQVGGAERGVAIGMLQGCGICREGLGPLVGTALRPRT